ncbi:hypothetical protein LTR70_008907 [Exophiala xenobiotica]|uniref:AAA+ ATPase domain-containing protein n=1 Tax=Lithohypha guttulata TaxID=1690604 RepID=A0ABR0K0H4_9EURO|nr:hypothetical protein LTR24_008900 [Lithohypha guttulata]KAK5311268.1 hypothetical protein LTR70_008907 [Exophiala xenobiotica]
MAAQQSEQCPASATENQQLPTPPPELANPSSEASKPTPDKMVDSGRSTGTSASTQNEEENSTKPSPLADMKVDSTSETEDKKPTKSDEAKDDAKKDDEGAKSKDSSKSDDKDKTEKKDDKKKEEEKKEEEKKKALPKGMKADLKQLWAKTDAQCKCCTTWVEEDPDDGKNVEESDECLQHAIVVRKKKKHEGNRKPLKVDSIVVHSPLIKRVLQTVFSGYPDMVIDLDELIFDAPFAPFFHRWEDFSRAVSQEQDEMTKSHLSLLHDAVAGELEKPIQRNKDLVRHKAIDFELLWTLYTPGTLMFSHDNGHDRLYETGDCEYWQDLSGLKFTVRCDIIDWDGENFGKVTLSEVINKFKGTRQIATLPSYPLRFHPKADEVYKKCVERGRRFQELSGVHCKDYKGTAVEYTKYSVQTVTSKRHLEGRIMLDEELFSKFNPDEAQSLRELGEDIEDVKKSEAEAVQRLGEQAQKAIEALKKAQEEEKQKEEKTKQDANEKKQEAGMKKETSKKDEASVESNDPGSPNEESAETPDNVSSKSETHPSDDSAEGKQTKKEPEIITELSQETATETKEATPDAEKQLDTSAVTASAPSEDTPDDKKGELPSSASTDSEGVPTPSSEDEEMPEKPKDYSNNEKQELKDDQLAICTSWLRGYSLAYQKWASFNIEHISNVTWNDDAFSELTLPPEYRELILATIQSQIRQNQWKQKMEKVEKERKPLSELSKDDENDDEDGAPQFDDFIAQKGLGYIMLFSGNPGVGKTATAESIAELLHVPLCIISVGNLGTSAESVESALQDILELASKWNAVLLLDEADIFLEQRTKHDLHRNAVVSVFLRLLEYYQGVLCLTTNRSEEIDVAFHSRIHISLPFPDLTENNREQIWRHFAKITNNKHEISAAKRKAGTEKKGATGTSQQPQPPPPSSAHSQSSEPAPSSEAAKATITTTNGTKTAEQPKSVNPENVNGNGNGNGLIDLSTSDFRKLSQTPLNGRQIKNAFKTAVLLASYKKEKVQMKHVKTALKTIDGNGLGRREVGGMYY